MFIKMVIDDLYNYNTMAKFKGLLKMGVWKRGHSVCEGRVFL